MTVENILSKGEIAHNEQFIHLPRCFQIHSLLITLSYLKITIFLPKCFQSCLRRCVDVLYVGINECFTCSCIKLKLINTDVAQMCVNSFSAKGTIELFANNTDSGETVRNKLSNLKSALFGCEL